MKFDYKGIRNINIQISDFIDFLLSINDNSLWEYQGMIVQIDPTVDYGNNNVLVRWRDVNEGFNDKIIYYNLAEFKKDFKLLN